MARSHSVIAVIALALLGCANNAEVVGTVRNIDDLTAIPNVAVGFGQNIDGEFTVRTEFTATTGGQGGYLMFTKLGPFPSGFVLFSHDAYRPDTVEFFGAGLGQRGRVDVNLVPLQSESDTSASKAGSSGR